MNRKNIQRTLEAALAHHKAGELDQAERLYAEVCKAAPKLYDAWYLAGALAVHRDKPDAAVPLLTRALRISPGATQCKLFLGMALADLGRFQEAEKPLRSALEKHPGYPEAWENLANVMCALDRPSEAADCLLRLLELQPDRIEIRERLAAMTTDVPVQAPLFT
jgi:tetratricopeptide (TPR) repeat protein